MTTTDLRSVAPRLQAAFGLESLAQAAKLFERYGPLLQQLFALLGPLLAPLLVQLRGAAGAAADADDSAPTPDPLKPALAPVLQERRIAGLRGHWFFIERKNTPYARGGGRFIIAKEEFRAIVAGEQGCQAGDRLHVDLTPFDQFGHDFLPGQDVNRLLLRGDGFPAMEHTVTGPGEITNEYDDYGCTPVVLVPWEDTTIRPGFEGIVGYRARLSVRNGRAVAAGVPTDLVFDASLPSIRVKPWGHPSLKG